MRVSFSPNAIETLENTSEFIDDMNIAGAGERWIERFVARIYEYARLNRFNGLYAESKILRMQR